MKKLFALILILGAVFWAGYYVGQQPPEEVKKQLQELSQEVMEQTIGLGEEELLAQKKFLQAMSRFLNGKAKILASQPDAAIAELEKTLDYLEEAARMKGEETSDAIQATMSKIRDLQDSLANDRTVPQKALEDAQEKLEALLS